MSAQYVIALDQGTTSSRAMLIDAQGCPVGVSQRPFRQIYPHPGWVEHDAREILDTQLGVLETLVADTRVRAEDIAAIGITNQRETTIVWDRVTGEPVANAIVWQCRRTADEVARIAADPQVAARITQKTGLIPDAYFSASKIAWILDNTPGARARAEAGELAFGTVDSWLMWNLTAGRVHATDVTNASRTMLFNIHEGTWDSWLLDLFNVPAAMLPEVRPSSGVFGEVVPAQIGEVAPALIDEAAPSATGVCAEARKDVLATLAGVPISGVAGDQQAALFGQCCFEAGEAKNTYGTGCFFLMHAGSEVPVSTHGLVTTIAASAPGSAGLEYALEGSVFIAGSLVQWLRDELHLIEHASETEALARSVEDTAGVYIVPAFAGLGAPYWNAEARGSVFGLTRGTSKAHFVRAALEALAYQLSDLMQAMAADAGVPITALNVDGGVTANDFLMQFQSDIINLPVRRPANVETTALGAAYLAGLATGFWENIDQLRALRSSDTVFEPHMDAAHREELLAGWKRAVASTIVHANG